MKTTMDVSDGKEITSFSIIEDRKELEKTTLEHNGILGRANGLALAIIDTESFQEAGRMLAQIKSALKKWNDSRQDAIDQAHSLHKTLIADRDNIGKPLRDAINVLSPAVSKYEYEAREKARIERERIEREAKKAEEDRRLEMAAELEKSGKMEAAESVLEEPIIAPPALVAEAPKVEGLSFQDYYSFEIEDFKKLIVAVAAGEIPVVALLPNDKFLGQQARSMKEHFKYPGVKLVHSRRSRSAGGF